MELTPEQQDIHRIILEKLGIPTYQSYFIKTPIRISGQHIDFIFTKPFTKQHAEKQYRSKAQDAIRTLFSHKNKEVRFILEKEAHEHIQDRYDGMSSQFNNYVDHEFKKHHSS